MDDRYFYPPGYDDLPDRPLSEGVGLLFEEILLEFVSDGESDPYAVPEGESQEYSREVVEVEDEDFADIFSARDIEAPRRQITDVEDEFFLYPEEFIREIEPQRIIEEEEEEREDQLVEDQESDPDEQEIETRRRLLETRQVEFTTPSSNRIKIELKPEEDVNNGNDENVVYCSICMNPYSSQGDHQVSCLPCGHLFGLPCIQRWIKHSKQRYSKCPICNQKCALKNVVKLYVSRLPVVERGKQENSVSFQPRDDLYKVHFAKYKEELADIKRELMKNTEYCERIKRIGMQDEYVEEMRKSYEQHLNEVEEMHQSYEQHINEYKEELGGIKRELMKNTKCCEEQSKRLELLDRDVEELLKERQANSRRVEEIQQFLDQENKKIQQITEKTISGLRRKLKKRKNELDAKNRAVEQLSKATEAKDRRIERLMKRIKRDLWKRKNRRELRIQPMLKGRLMDYAHRRSISDDGKAKDRKMEQLSMTVERQDLQIQQMSKRRRLMDPAPQQNIPHKRAKIQR